MGSSLIFSIHQALVDTFGPNLGFLFETANFWDTIDEKEKQIGESIKLVYCLYYSYQSIKQNKINKIK
jgi:hypothetical protein